MKIEIKELHWIENADPQNDMCAHGKVEIQIGKHKQNFNNDSYTLSATGLFLLRTINGNYYGKNDWGNFLLPCCGHGIYPNIDQETLSKGYLVYISGCLNGFDWSIVHKNSKVIHTTDEDQEDITLWEWIDIVNNFTDKIEQFYNQSDEKCLDGFEKENYDLFWKEWNSWKNRIKEKLTES